jgi:hypothetical protein
VAALADKWRAMAAAGGSGEVEVDVAEWFQEVTEEAITRVTFGSSYNDGRTVFAMQNQLMAFASEAFRKVLVPGYRYVLCPPAPLVHLEFASMASKNTPIDQEYTMFLRAGSCQQKRTGCRGSWTEIFDGA